MTNKKIIFLVSILILILIVGFLGKRFIYDSNPKTVKQSENLTKTLTVEEEKVAKQENQNFSNFYSRGSYTTSKPIIVEGYEIIIFLETVKNEFENFDDPEYIDPKGYIRLLDSKNNYKDYDCQNPSISKEKVSFKSIETPVGVITIDGIFVDKQGQPWNKMHAENYETVLRGTLTIEDNGEIKYSQLHDFVYWDGTGD